MFLIGGAIERRESILCHWNRQLNCLPCERSHKIAARWDETGRSLLRIVRAIVRDCCTSIERSKMQLNIVPLTSFSNWFTQWRRVNFLFGGLNFYLRLNKINFFLTIYNSKISFVITYLLNLYLIWTEIYVVFCGHYLCL